VTLPPLPVLLLSVDQVPATPASQLGSDTNLLSQVRSGGVSQWHSTLTTTTLAASSECPLPRLVKGCYESRGARRLANFVATKLTLSCDAVKLPFTGTGSRP
jgi:hypothetical protein